MEYETGLWARGASGAGVLCVCAGIAVGLLGWTVTGVVDWLAWGAAYGSAAAAVLAVAALVRSHLRNGR